jgi:hypothetical protein
VLLTRKPSTIAKLLSTRKRKTNPPTRKLLKTARPLIHGKEKRALPMRRASKIAKLL